ncbi:DUF1194 domain-containing protein [Pseudoponticoccus marisrubri]|uniref:VWFA domain-containing protein n=1 Tax=Pseudoponticoccus marisrubri TaxID=1685382 RepID=A0A0W7WGC9_9RHOB|nr:DUF1194 domain-containing protein [Pseudoponticoccus marisrubri]KUF09649.1 hypothetical protein AVJ23_15945 [Pseudoponticoccus marisrubri]
MKALALVAALMAGSAEAACRQALALGLDVSGSVDAREYRLQMDGLAAALTHPEVRAAFLALPETPVALAVFEWSGPGHHRVVLDWTDVTGPDSLAQIAGHLRGVARVEAEASTAIGTAKRFGAALLARRPGCWRDVLDLSGDGMSNTGPRPRDVRAPGITVNGLVIGTGGADGIGALANYYRDKVISGPDAFVETALGFADFEAAMVRKLKRELQVQVVSQVTGTAAAQ